MFLVQSCGIVSHEVRFNPAKILGLTRRGSLGIGDHADVTIIDPDVEWSVDARQFHSKSANTPFDGWQLFGRADTVIVGGRVKFRVAEAVSM